MLITKLENQSTLTQTACLGGEKSEGGGDRSKGMETGDPLASASSLKIFAR
jgi:hypothetical protein